MCLQTLAKHFKVQLKSSCGGLLAEVESQKIILFQPLSQMNVSGPAIKKVMKKFAIEPKQLIVLHDNLEADMGNVKQSATKGSQGHNGLKSINESLGGRTDYVKVSIGVGRPTSRDKTIVSNYVLGQFGS
jgi:PTH1 family peptidyl-tRNA hydrolase